MVKYDTAFLTERIQSTARDLQQRGIINENVIFIVVMNGGVWFAVHFLDCLDLPNQVFFVKLHSYQGSQQSALVWDYCDLPDLTNRDVIVLDDICDSGTTSRALLDKLEEFHPQSVRFVTLLQRTSTDATGLDLTSCIVDDSKDFFYGCGLDAHDGFDRFHPYVAI